MASEEKLTGEHGREAGRRGEGGSTRLSQQVREGAYQVGEGIGRIAEQTEEGVHNLKDRFRETRDTVVNRTRDAARSTNSYVNENPWVAVGISAGVGFLLGMLLSPRNRFYS